jgi:serine/threonine-protein kinase
MAEEKGKDKAAVGLPIGTRIGKYEVVERRAVGGQAIVYKAHDPLLDRDVAIKQISTHLAEDPKFLERFRKEAQILARLGAHQPSIVTIHEMIEQPEGLFIVMEFLSGHTLETTLQETQGPVEVKATVQLLFRLAAALHDVHQAGIIHRDIKPANIIVQEGLHPKITDFGVAASASGQTSMVLGTTKYMAPELFEGQDVDARADMYSLGMIAYEMLAGRRRFNEIFADIVRDRHSEALRWMKWHGNPDVQAPPLHEVNPQVPRALSEIVARMMAKDRDRRFADMEALGRAIKQAFSPRGRRPAPRTPAPRAARAPTAVASEKECQFAQRSGLGPGDGADELEVGAEPPPTAAVPKPGLSVRTKILAAGVVFVTLLAGVIGLVVRGRMRQTDLQRRATAAFDEIREHYDAGRYGQAIEGFQTIRRRYAGTPEAAKASVLIPMATAYLALAEADTRDEWEQQSAQALSDADRRLDEIQRQRNDLDQWAESLAARIEEVWQTQRATRSFREAMQLARTALDANQFDAARSKLTGSPMDQVRLTEAQKARVGALRRQIDLKEFRTVYAGHLAAADAALSKGDQTGELAMFDRAAERYQKAATWLQARGGVLPEAERAGRRKELAERTGAVEKARAYHRAMQAAAKASKAGNRVAERDALKRAAEARPSDELARRIGGIESAIAYDKGMDAMRQSQFAEARDWFGKALAFDKDNAKAEAALEALGKSERRLALVAKADSAFDTGQYAEALAAYREAAEIEAGDHVAQRILECRFRLAMAQAEALRAEKQYDEALKAYESARRIKPSEAAAIDARISDMRHRQRYEGLIAQGRRALDAKQWTKAREHFDEAAKLIPDAPEAAEGIRKAKYGDYLDRGRRAMAQDDYRRALAYLDLAKQQEETEEVKKLIAEAESKLEE